MGGGDFVLDLGIFKTLAMALLVAVASCFYLKEKGEADS